MIDHFLYIVTLNIHSIFLSFIREVLTEWAFKLMIVYSKKYSHELNDSIWQAVK